MPGPSAPQPKQEQQEGPRPARTFDNQAHNPARQVSREAFWMKHGIDRTGDYY